LPTNEENISEQTIDKSKQSEETLRESEERFYKIFNLNPAAMAITTFDGRFIQINKSFEHLTGYSSKEVIGKTGNELGLYLNPAQRKQIIEQLIEEKRVISKELEQRDRSGGIRNVLMSYEIIKTEKDANILSIAIDITERKKAEKALKASETRLSSVFENSMDAILLTAPDGRIFKANPTAQRMLGMTEQEIIEAGRQGIVVSDGRLANALKERNEKGRANAELTVRRKDGSTLSVEVTSSLFIDSDGLTKTSMIFRDITERKKAEQALQNSEKHKNDILESIKDGFVAFDKEWRYTYANSNAARILHTPKEGLIGKVAIDVFPNASKFLAEFTRAVLSGHAVHFEEYYPEPLNIWYECHCYPSEEGLTVFFSDITQRKKAEEELKASEAKLNAAFASMNEAVFIADSEGRLIEFNDEFVRYHRFKNREECSRTINDCPKYLEAFFADGTPAPPERWAMARALRGETATNFEYMLRSKETGEVWWGSYNFGAMTDNSGKVTGAIVTCREITERKKVEKELLAVNERFEMAQRAAGVGIWDWDLKSGKINWSTEMFRLFGLDPKENVASFEEWDKVLHPEDKEEAGFKIQQALKEKSFLNNIYRIILPNGQIVWINSLGKGEYNNQGEPIRMTGICVDITARKIADERHEEYKKNLEKLVEERTEQLKHSERLAAIGATAGMVGHDIRNPLQAITSDVYLAKTELASMAESEGKLSIQESLTEIEKNIDYINKIVQDLQDYARPLNPNPGEADLQLIIDKLLQKNGLPKNVKVSVNIEDNARKFVADSDYLNRILYNLVTNAVQAMPQGGKLTIHVYKEANDFIITVKDTGVGIPKAIQSKMFTPMFTTKSKGQGFGLPVVKRMTESLGGTVSFESEEGKGTTFTIHLPQIVKK